jgi:hypothetical protein
MIVAIKALKIATITPTTQRMASGRSCDRSEEGAEWCGAFQNRGKIARADDDGNDRDGGGKRSNQAGEQDHAAHVAVRFGQLLAKRDCLITAAGGVGRADPCQRHCANRDWP